MYARLAAMPRETVRATADLAAQMADPVRVAPLVNTRALKAPLPVRVAPLIFIQLPWALQLNLRARTALPNHRRRLAVMSTAIVRAIADRLGPTAGRAHRAVLALSNQVREPQHAIPVRQAPTRPWEASLRQPASVTRAFRGLPFFAGFLMAVPSKHAVGRHWTSSLYKSMPT